MVLKSMPTLSEFFIRVNDINEYSCNKIDFFYNFCLF